MAASISSSVSTSASCSISASSSCSATPNRRLSASASASAQSSRPCDRRPCGQARRACRARRRSLGGTSPSLVSAMILASALPSTLSLSLGGARDRGVERGAAHQRLLALVEHREMRRHLRFERKALQQPLAEAVDGVDLESAFGFERAGEQAPRGAQVLLLGRAPHQRRERLRASSSLDRRPVRQAPRAGGSASPPPRSWCRSGRGSIRA